MNMRDNEMLLRTTVRNITSIISKYVDDSALLNTNTRYTPEAKKEMSADKRDKFKSAMTEKTSRLFIQVSQFRSDVRRERDNSERLYIPSTDTESLVYHAEKSDFIEKLKTKRPAQILEDYNEYIGLGSGFKRVAQMYEDSAFPVLYSLNTDVAISFKTTMERNIKKRIPQTVIDAQSRLLKYETLERTAQRIEDAFTSTNTFPTADLYVFMSLAKSLDLSVDTEVNAVTYKQNISLL